MKMRRLSLLVGLSESNLIFVGIRSQAFVKQPAMRRSALFSSSSKRIPGAGLRRSRPQASSDSLVSLVERLQKEEGKYMDIRFGRLELAATLEEQEVQVPELPPTFPLQGKNPGEEPPRMRFAPSPTGSLHVGGARTALYNWLVAKKGQLENRSSNAAFVIRVEDTDLARSTKGKSDHVVEIDCPR
jgi:hypothetical protein